MKEVKYLGILIAVVFTLIGIVAGFLFGLGSKECPEPDHRICAKAIEIKVNEADSLKLELAKVKDQLAEDERIIKANQEAYQEVYGKEELKPVKP